MMEELMKFTLLVRDSSDYLIDRYSERKDAGKATLAAQLSAIATSHEDS